MSALNGAIRRSSFSLPSNGTPNENLYDANFANGLGNKTAQRVNSALTVTQPVRASSTKTLNGQVKRSFADLWFDRIHLIPNLINVGNLVAQQVRTIEFFNGYVSSNAVLTGVQATGESGIDFDYGILPRTIKALSSIFLTLTINESGSPDFNAHYEFAVTGKDAPDLRVIGTRVVTFPFRHDWSENYREKFAYLTDVTTSEDGGEQRRMFGGGVPRRSLVHQVRLQNVEFDDVKLHARIRNKFLSLLRGWQHRLVCVPILCDEEQLLEDLPAGAAEIIIETASKDYAPGSYIMFYLDEFNFDLIEIEAVAANLITFARPVATAYPAGATTISPARFARIKAGQDFNEITKGMISAQVEFDLEESQDESVVRQIPHNMPQYRGRFVWLPLSTPPDDKTHSIARVVNIFDAATGKVWQSSIQKAGRETTALENYFLNRTEIGRLFGWLSACRGELVEFWYPTDEFDFEVLTDIGPNSSTLTVTNSDYSRFVYEQDNLRHVMIKMIDGSSYFREITSAVANAGNAEIESINLDSPLSTTQTITAEQIDRVCYLRLVRLKSDNQEIEWMGSQTVVWNPLIFDVLGEEDATDGF